MIKEEAIAKLAQLQTDDDTESAHGDADDILCELLQSLGYADVVDAYAKIDKWYAQALTKPNRPRHDVKLPIYLLEKQDGKYFRGY